MQSRPPPWKDAAWRLFNAIQEDRVLLIAAGGLVSGGFLFGFFWAVRAGQFDDVATPPVRMLLDESDSTAKERSARGITHVQSRQ